MKNPFENLHMDYASNWGITDFYDQYEAALREAIDSDEDFDTGWFGCKKEIRSARYVRENGKFKIEVSGSMDDLWEADDLIYDALWESCGTEEELPQYIIDSIRDAAIDNGIDDHYTTKLTIRGNVTFEDVLEKTSEIEDHVCKQLDHWYKLLCDIVKDHYEYMNRGDNHEDQA